MAKITVEILNSEKLLKQQLGIIVKMAEKDVEKAAKATEQVIRFNIQTSLQRPGSTGKLAQSFFAEKIPSGWGVGNISYLDNNAPYWRWINFGVAKSGRSVPPSTGGFFTPGQGQPSQAAFRQGRFVKASGTFFINPTRPIQAHNYIARTVQQINFILNGVLNHRRTI